MLITLILAVAVSSSTIAVVAAPSTYHRFGLTEAMPRIANGKTGTIRVASYNMLNYFDQVDDPTLQGRYDDFGDNPGPTSVARCQELAKAIRAVDADILALEEVESKSALEHFNKTYLKGMGYTYIASQDVGYYRGCEQSLLSRFPITQAKTWPNADLKKVKRFGGGWSEIPRDADADDFTFQRSPLFATVTTPSGYELSLFVLHHKAGQDRWRREGEALQVQQYIADLQQSDPHRNIIVLGDFNAQPWDRSMQVYEEAGMVDAMNIRADIEHGYASPLRTTHTSGRVIDFILLNNAALGELVPSSGFVLGTSAQDYDWRNDPIPAGYASDHYPIAIDLVPQEGQGNAVTAAPWPRSAMRKALAASPMQEADLTASSSSSHPESPATPVGDGLYIASARSKVFHVATCSNAKKISEKNLASYASAAAAAQSGRRPAKCCNPE